MFSGNCGGPSTTQITGNIVGTPASNPFAGGPTTITPQAAAAAAAVAPTSSTANKTSVAATGCAGCSGASMDWTQLLIGAVVIAVVVAIVVKKL